MNQSPDTKLGAYYVSMVDGPRFALLSGPYLDDHAAALADVEPAKKIAQEVDSRAHWYAFGTCRLEPDVEHPPGVLQKRGLMSPIESPARASRGALHGGDSANRPQPVAAEPKGEEG